MLGWYWVRWNICACGIELMSWYQNLCCLITLAFATTLTLLVKLRVRGGIPLVESLQVMKDCHKEKFLTNSRVPNYASTSRIYNAIWMMQIEWTTKVFTRTYEMTYSSSWWFFNNLIGDYSTFVMQDANNVLIALWSAIGIF